MAEIIEAAHIFAPEDKDVFVSGDIVEPGTYRDTGTGEIITLFQAGTLPDEVRIMRFPRRFHRLSKTAKSARRRAASA